MDQNEQTLRIRVKQQILELIGRMDFEFTTRLLSENQLASKFQVSRSTIRTVLSELEVEGKVIRRHGSGTYVNPPALDVETTLYPKVNMYDLILKNGYTPGLKVLSYTEMMAGERASKLNLFSFDRITEVRSIYYADQKPVMYCIDCVESRRFEGMDWKIQEENPRSIYDCIRNTIGVEIAWDIIKIQAAHTGQLQELKECFSVPNGEIKPLVRLEITNFDKLNQATLLGNIYVDTDKIRLNIIRDLTK